MGWLGLRSLKGQSITNSICWVISMAPASISLIVFLGQSNRFKWTKPKPSPQKKTSWKVWTFGVCPKNGCSSRSSPVKNPWKKNNPPIWMFPKIGVYIYTPKWMVKIMENPIKMDDLGGKTHYFWKHPFDSPNFFRKISPWSHLLMQWQWTVSCGARGGTTGHQGWRRCPPLRNQQRIINKKNY